MAKKNALQEAIAEAKQLRQAAIVNATKQLEENLTPSIKAMLERKLEEEFDEDAANVLDEDVNSGFKKVKEPKEVKTEAEDPEEKEDEKEEKPEEGENNEDAENSEAESEEGSEEEEPAEEQPEETEEEPENPEDEKESEELSDDTPLKDITLGDLKAIIAQEMANAAPVEQPTDLESPEAGDVEGQGDEVPAGDLAATAPEDVPADDAAPVEEPADPELVNPENPEKKKEDDDEEIDINEILKELENDNTNDVMPTGKRGDTHDGGAGEDVHQDNSLKEGNKEDKCPECGKAPCECDKESAAKKVQYETVVRTNKVLRDTLAEVNVLNSKLVYSNRVLRRRDLTESQKNDILRELDKAKTINEVKSTYANLIGNSSARKDLVENRNRRFASKSAGASTKPDSIVEENSFVRRMQELAGIIE